MPDSTCTTETKTGEGLPGNCCHIVLMLLANIARMLVMATRMPCQNVPDLS